MRKISEFKRIIIIITHSLHTPPPPSKIGCRFLPVLNLRFPPLLSVSQSSKNQHKLFDLIAPYIRPSSLRRSHKILLIVPDIRSECDSVYSPPPVFKTYYISISSYLLAAAKIWARFDFKLVKQLLQACHAPEKVSFEGAGGVTPHPPRKKKKKKKRKKRRKEVKKKERRELWITSNYYI